MENRINFRYRWPGPPVKFHPKLVDTRIPWFIILIPFVLNFGVYLTLELLRPSRIHALFAIGWTASLLLWAGAILTLRCVYWEPTPDCLIVRKLWRRRVIPWSEVTDVGWLGPMSGTFRVNIGRRIEDYDTLCIEPSNPTGLADVLRRFAPHANFALD